MTDMDMPLPEPLDYCYEWDGPYGSRKFSAALHNGRPPDRSVAIYTADQLRARDAQWRAIVAAEVAKELERIRTAIMAKHEAANGQHNLYHCLAVELFGDEAIRSSAPLQCNRVPPALRSAGRRPCTSRAWLSGLRWLRPCFDQALMPGSALSRLPDRLDNPLEHRPRCAVTWGLQLWARCCQVRRYLRRLWR